MKRFLASMGALALTLLLLCPGAVAAEELPLYMEGSSAEGNVLQLYYRCGDPEAGKAENIAAALDGTPVEVQSVCTYAYLSLGTSYVILADTNTAVTQRALPDMREVAEEIAAGMGPGDNACVLALNQRCDEELLTSDPEALREQIDSLRGGGKADLYDSIAGAIEMIQSSERILPRACLVVMADGLDSSLSGISRSELEKRITDSGVTLCTVALTYNTANTQRIEAGKTLSGFARMSNGGAAILLRTEGVTPKDAGDAVLQLESSAYVAVISADALRSVTDQDSAQLTLSFTGENATVSAAATVDLTSFPVTAAPDSQKDDNGAQQEATPAPQSPAPEPEAGPGVEKSGFPGFLRRISFLEGFTNRALYCVLACAGLLIIAAVGIPLLLGRKKRVRARKAQWQVPEEDVPPEVVRFDNAASYQTPPLNAKGPHLLLVRMGERESIRCDVVMGDSLLIGSDPERAQLLINEDPLLAPVSCRLDWRDGKLWITDLQGGLILNGAAAGRPSCPAQPGDVLCLGSFQYRLFWDIK